METHLVFLDSNAIIGNQFRILTSPLLKHFINMGNKIIISEVVLEEVIRKYEKDMIDARNELDKIKNHLKRVGMNIAITESKSKEEFVDEFKQELQSLNVFVLDMETSSIRDMFNKVMKYEKPFKYKKENGSIKERGGIKDAIIWSSMVNYLREQTEKHTIVFVNDDSDFVERSKESGSTVLHEELLSDLQEIGIDSGNVVIMSSIKDLIQKVVQTELEKMNQSIATEIENTGSYINFSVDELVNKYSFEVDEKMDKVIKGQIGEETEYQLSWLTVLDDINIKKRFRLDEGNRVYVEFSKPFAITLEFTIDFDSFWNLDEEFTDRCIVSDDDWEINDTSSIQCRFILEVNYEAVFDSITGEVFEDNVLDDPIIHLMS